MAPISDQSMRAVSPASDFDDNDGDHFFDANPGIKRAKSNDSSDRRQDEIQYSTNVKDTSGTRRSSSSIANKSASHKRIRTQPPAPPQGVKRAAAPIRRLSDIQPDSQQQLSDGETSFSRKLPPKKRARSSVAPKKASSLTAHTGFTSGSSQMSDTGETVPTIDEKAITLPRKVRCNCLTIAPPG